MTELSDAALRTVQRLGPASARRLAGLIESGVGDEAIVAADQEYRDLLATVPTDRRPMAVAYLRGAAAGYEHGVAQQRVDVVWTGPSVHGAPTRSTAQVLTELIGRARRELILVTYSARPYQPILDALSEAVDRGVAIDAVVETLQGAGSALTGSEPAATFAHVPTIRLWHWPKAARPTGAAKMHAKIAVADCAELFASSVNLTESGVANSIEAGVLVRGGTAPERAAEHVRGLIAAGVLVPLQ